MPEGLYITYVKPVPATVTMDCLNIPIGTLFSARYSDGNPERRLYYKTIYSVTCLSKAGGSYTFEDAQSKHFFDYRVHTDYELIVRD